MRTIAVANRKGGEGKTILAFNLFGDGLRDALDPKMRK